MNTGVLEIRKGILNKNDEIARGLRSRLQAAGVLAVNWCRAPAAVRPHFCSAPSVRFASRGRLQPPLPEILRRTTTPGV